VECDSKHCVDRHVEIPINRVIFFEFAGLLFDTSAVLENELEVGGRAFLEKIDRDIYVAIVSLLNNDFRDIYTLQMNISVSVAVSILLVRKQWVQD
jgi:hypothetical protein